MKVKQKVNWRKPSSVIRAMLRDLKAARKDPRYVIDMNIFHEVDGLYDDLCHVCAAGAVIRGTLGAKPNQARTPQDYGPQIQNALWALDDLRLGWVDDFLCRFNKEVPAGVRKSVTPYHRSPRGFALTCGRLANELERVGL